MRLRDPAAQCARGLLGKSRPLEPEGAVPSQEGRRRPSREDAVATPRGEQGRPGARCTRDLACKNSEKDAHEHTGSAEAVRPSLRNGVTVSFALSPVTGFLATVARVMRSIIANLTPASGRQDHTTSPSA